MIKKTTRKIPATNVQARKPIRASQNITAGVRNRQTANRPVMASLSGLTPEQRAFAMQLQSNIRKNAPIMGATNTTNIPAKPEFLELLPLFVQKLLILDVYGSVAMKSRQQLIPYFKFSLHIFSRSNLSSPAKNRTDCVYPPVIPLPLSAFFL